MRSLNYIFIARNQMETPQCGKMVIDKILYKIEDDVWWSGDECVGVNLNWF